MEHCPLYHLYHPYITVIETFLLFTYLLIEAIPRGVFTPNKVGRFQYGNSKILNNDFKSINRIQKYEFMKEVM